MGSRALALGASRAPARLRDGIAPLSEQYDVAAPLAAFTGKLSRLIPLQAADRDAIAKLPFQTEKVGIRHMLVREGDIPVNCCVLLEGYACRHKSTRSGGRQIVSFHLPGDILDVQH